jgi:N-acetylglucosaminyldiphosphoundecaprenol N-acetyl-beta-D-mannosaminyltransferase
METVNIPLEIPRQNSRNLEYFRLFEISLTDTTLADAKALMEELVDNPQGKPAIIFFVHTSTINNLFVDPTCRDMLSRANFVFADGAGVRWATRFITGRRLMDNVNGTDLVPKFLQDTHGKNYKYFLLGATQGVIERAARQAAILYPHSALVGYHHGFIEPRESTKVIDLINRSGAQILFVGMGNPVQERWIIENVEKLKTPLIVAVGGLFNYWAGVLSRAPRWVRKIGMEWAYILLQQPEKWRRYLIGNPYFIFRVVRKKYKLDGK